MSVDVGSWFDEINNTWRAEAIHLESTGDTRSEAISNMREKIEQFVRETKEEGNSSITFSW